MYLMLRNWACLYTGAQLCWNLLCGLPGERVANPLLQRSSGRRGSQGAAQRKLQRPDGTAPRSPAHRPTAGAGRRRCRWRGATPAAPRAPRRRARLVFELPPTPVVEQQGGDGEGQHQQHLALGPVASESVGKKDEAGGDVAVEGVKQLNRVLLKLCF